MYLTDIVESLITEKLKNECIGKNVTFRNALSRNYDEITIQCKDVKFDTDDGDCWITFFDESGTKYIANGQGLDIWFKIV